VTAALLTVVLLVALGILSTTIPANASVPEPIDIALDFDTFLPGETQTQTHPIVVPSAARFAEAGIVHATGIAQQVQWTFRLCENTTTPATTTLACSPVATGHDVPAGSYTLEVSALLDANVSGDGSVAGRVRLEQADGVGASGFTPMHWMIAAAMLAVTIGGLAAVASARRRPARTDDSSITRSRPERPVGSAA
jgi:hypothetical protein